MPPSGKSLKKQMWSLLDVLGYDWIPFWFFEPSLTVAPLGNHGEIIGDHPKTMNRHNAIISAPTAASSPPPAPERPRLSLDLSPSVSLLLDHISAVTGTPKSQIAIQALVDALPALLDRADTLQKRTQAIGQAQKVVKK